MATKRVTVTIDDRVYRTINILAKGDDRSFSNFVNKILKEKCGIVEIDSEEKNDG